MPTIVERNTATAPEPRALGGRFKRLFPPGVVRSVRREVEASPLAKTDLFAHGKTIIVDTDLRTTPVDVIDSDTDTEQTERVTQIDGVVVYIGVEVQLVAREQSWITSGPPSSGWLVIGQAKVHQLGRGIGQPASKTDRQIKIRIAVGSHVPPRVEGQLLHYVAGHITDHTRCPDLVGRHVIHDPNALHREQQPRVVIVINAQRASSIPSRRHLERGGWVAIEILQCPRSVGPTHASAQTVIAVADRLATDRGLKKFTSGAIAKDVRPTLREEPVRVELIGRPAALG